MNKFGSSLIEDDGLDRYNNSLYLEKDLPDGPRGKDLGLSDISRYNVIDTITQDEKLPNEQNSVFQRSIGTFHTLDTFDNYVWQNKRETRWCQDLVEQCATFDNDTRNNDNLV